MKLRGELLSGSVENMIRVMGEKLEAWRISVLNQKDLHKNITKFIKEKTKNKMSYKYLVEIKKIHKEKERNIKRYIRQTNKMLKDGKEMKRIIDLMKLGGLDFTRVEKILKKEMTNVLRREKQLMSINYVISQKLKRKFEKNIDKRK